MLRLVKADPVAIGSAATSGGFTGFALWLSNVNEILQFLALVIAIGSGIYSFYRAKKKTDDKAE